MPTYQIRLHNPEKGLDVTIPCRDDQPILEAAEMRGLALPYSCRSAACGTCAGKLERGSVHIDDQSILGEGDIANGFTLLCSGHPRSDCTILTHQQDELETV